MKKKRINFNRIDKNARNVMMPCIECRKMAKFHVENEIVKEGEGIIAVNIPCAVCQDCVHSVLDRVADPPGLVCIKNLSPVLVEEIIESLDFLLPRESAVEFFRSIFPAGKE
jgi:hypothetical protein